MKRLLTSALVLTCLLPLAAEKVKMSPEKLKETATHVLVGKVNAIYAKKVEDAKWRTMHYVAEVSVTEVETGEGLAKDGLVYARYWTREWIGAGMPPPGTNGHAGCPEEGATVRIYLAKNAYDGFSDQNKDGGYNVIGANGFETLPDKK